jgi:hypothetical protein
MSIRQAPYGVRQFDLSQPRDNERVNINANNLSILSADDTVRASINDPRAAKVDLREISSITIPPEGGEEFGIERIYLENPSGTGDLVLLSGFAGASGSTSTPSDDQTDVSDRFARELGKARLEDDTGALITSSNPLPVQDSGGGNSTSIDSNSIQPTTGSTFPAQSVPTGRSVTYKADTSNSGTIDVDATYPPRRGRGNRPSGG